ncbi:MAG: glutamate-5-semialdehyde dehydrogenase [Ruminococcaceae bacterium]|nr:glutamate-5-semialdehyde dehydrogenase [Oscillospiraceae bacterium]
MKKTENIIKKAKLVSGRILRAKTNQKNKALLAMADALQANSKRILNANRIDVDAAKGVISDVMIDRLMLDEKRIKAMADGIRQVADLPDPVGRILSTHTLPNGLVVEKTSVPFGVIGIIYESRPNVTSDAAALAIKSGNACVLRIGKEAFNSAFAIVEAMREGLKTARLPAEGVSLIEDTSRNSAEILMKADGYIDLLIPRGGKQLINSCKQNATVPCILTGTGICHIYIDKSADIDKALKIVENAKMSRPSVCNAAEVCIVHKDIAQDFLPKLKKLLTDPEREHICSFLLDDASSKIIDGGQASYYDYDVEFLDYKLAIRIVNDVKEAVEHISLHSTNHSESIISEDKKAIKYFTTNVDSSAVYVNASTRFTDGGEFGLGCEMGISTQKLHARGPMGLEELNTYKYIVTGNGQIR